MVHSKKLSDINDEQQAKKSLELNGRQRHHLKLNTHQAPHFEVNPKAWWQVQGTSYRGGMTINKLAWDTLFDNRLLKLGPQTLITILLKD